VGDVGVTSRLFAVIVVFLGRGLIAARCFILALTNGTG
jgi:hypothetical protein